MLKMFHSEQAAVVPAGFSRASSLGDTGAELEAGFATGWVREIERSDRRKEAGSLKKKMEKF